MSGCTHLRPPASAGGRGAIKDLPPSVGDVTEPGWYPDPEGKGQRWWDGERWTQATSTGPAAPVDNKQGFPSRRQTTILVGAVAVAIGAVLLSRALLPEKETITGTVTINELVDAGSSPCSGEGGYSDITEGLGVVVKNEEGTTLANGSLGEGRREGEPIPVCTFPFTITDVPKAEFYSVSAGRRGELTYSYDEMVEQDWKVALSIGDFSDILRP
jgi:hypothetical protein